eukprot:403354603
MGNTDSRKTFKHGSVLATLQHMHLMSGDQINGEVHYKLLKEFPGEHLTVELVGKEKVIWEGHDKKNASPKHPGKIVMKKEILNVKQTLKKFDKLHVESGQATFPFSFELPRDLPPSLFYLGQKDAKIQITYKVIAKMEEPIINGKSTFKPLVSKRLVIVSTPVEKINFNVSMKQENHIKALLFMNSGKSKADVNLDKDAYQPNETINLSINLDNSECDQDVKRAKVRFIREITAVSAHGVEYKDQTILMKRVCEGVNQRSSVNRTVQLPLDQVDFAVDSHLKDFKKRQPLYAEEMREWLTAMQPSVKGSYFECKYYAKISFKHSAMTLGKKIGEIYVPISVYYLSKSFVQAPREHRFELEEPSPRSMTQDIKSTSQVAGVHQDPQTKLQPEPQAYQQFNHQPQYQQPQPQQYSSYNYMNQSVAYGQPVAQQNSYAFVPPQNTQVAGGSLYPSLDLPPLQSYTYNYQQPSMSQTMPAQSNGYNFNMAPPQQQFQAPNAQNGAYSYSFQDPSKQFNPQPQHQ